MPIVVVTTAGSKTANSYGSLDEGNTYHEGHSQGALWIAATEDARNRALVTATRQLDAWFEWEGDVSFAEQVLLWPRIGVIGRTGYLLDSETIPPVIRNATAELARSRLTNAGPTDAADDIQRLKAGPVDITFREGKETFVIPEEVLIMVKHIGTPRIGRARFTTARLVRT